jgi:hypothetical protein
MVPTKGHKDDIKHQPRSRRDEMAVSYRVSAVTCLDIPPPIESFGRWYSDFRRVQCFAHVASITPQPLGGSDMLSAFRT